MRWLKYFVKQIFLSKNKKNFIAFANLSNKRRSCHLEIIELLKVKYVFYLKIIFVDIVSFRMSKHRSNQTVIIVTQPITSTFIMVMEISVCWRGGEFWLENLFFNFLFVEKHVFFWLLDGFFKIKFDPESSKDCELWFFWEFQIAL